MRWYWVWVVEWVCARKTHAHILNFQRKGHSSAQEIVASLVFRLTVYLYGELSEMWSEWACLSVNANWVREIRVQKNATTEIEHAIAKEQLIWPSFRFLFPFWFYFRICARRIGNFFEVFSKEVAYRVLRKRAQLVNAYIHIYIYVLYMLTITITFTITNIAFCFYFAWKLVRHCVYATYCQAVLMCV